MDSKRLESVGQEMDRLLAHLLRPGGEIDKKVRKPFEDWLSTEVILEGAIRVKTTLAAWLTLVTKAHQAGWPLGPSIETVTAAEARQFAAALARAELGRKWLQQVAAVIVLARAGELKVVAGSPKSDNVVTGGSRRTK
jgi:hypothetical protein